MDAHFVFYFRLGKVKQSLCTRAARFVSPKLFLGPTLPFDPNLFSLWNIDFSVLGCAPAPAAAALLVGDNSTWKTSESVLRHVSSIGLLGF